MKIGDHFTVQLPSGAGATLLWARGGYCNLSVRRHDLGGVQYDDLRLTMEDIWTLAETFPRPELPDTWADDALDRD